MVPFWETEGPVEVAAADAFADESGAGIGGFWLPAGQALDPANTHWFAFAISESALPEWFSRNEGEGGKAPLQSLIASLEALAHMIARPAHFGRICLRQLCDNFGVVASSAKASSMKQPLCYVLQALSYFAVKHHVQLQISHLSGERNIWADALSRGPSKEPELWSHLSLNRREALDLQELLKEPWDL